MLLHAAMSSPARAMRVPDGLAEAQELQARGFAMSHAGVLRPTADGEAEFRRRSYVSYRVG